MFVVWNEADAFPCRVVPGGHHTCTWINGRTLQSCVDGPNHFETTQTVSWQHARWELGWFIYQVFVGLFLFFEVCWVDCDILLDCLGFPFQFASWLACFVDVAVVVFTVVLCRSGFYMLNHVAITSAPMRGIPHLASIPRCMETGPPPHHQSSNSQKTNIYIYTPPINIKMIVHDLPEVSLKNHFIQAAFFGQMQ